MNDLLKYQEINNSFKKKLIFHLGSDAGFFSEYNNMILAMLYCLTHKIKFVLFSKNAKFRYKLGWNDYFLPFCEESDRDFHITNNFRYPRYILKRQRFKYWINKKRENCNYLTFELWNQLRDRANEQINYQVPELNINGGLRSACQKLVNLTWNYNEPTKEKIDHLIQSLNLPEEYIGMHIRSGDKFLEANLLQVNNYFEKISLSDPVKNVFVLTDDYRIIEEIHTKYPQYKIYTLCNKEERGYFHGQFSKEERMVVKEAHERLFASIDILSKSCLFIGTFSSNPGMYLGMRMETSKAISVDLDEWQIW